jgi:hypothetical protein
VRATDGDCEVGLLAANALIIGRVTVLGTHTLVTWAQIEMIFSVRGLAHFSPVAIPCALRPQFGRVFGLRLLPVGVAAVADVENLHDGGGLVDGVPDAVLPAARAPVPFEGLSERCSDAVRVFGGGPV